MRQWCMCASIRRYVSCGGVAVGAGCGSFVVLASACCRLTLRAARRDLYPLCSAGAGWSRYTERQGREEAAHTHPHAHPPPAKADITDAFAPPAPAPPPPHLVRLALICVQGEGGSIMSTALARICYTYPLSLAHGGLSCSAGMILLVSGACATPPLPPLLPPTPIPHH
jgi:hypothetical protein